MLEKHLGHLKKNGAGIEMGAPPPPPGVVSAKRSFKSEDSPVTSPATASNWNSPGGLTGVSPAASNHTADDPYMHAVHNNAGPPPYGIQPGITPGPHQAPMYNTSPGGPMSAPPRQALPPGLPPHRRGPSEMSGGPPEMSDAKRHQMYAPGPPQAPPMGQPITPHPMHQPMPRGPPR